MITQLKNLRVQQMVGENIAAVSAALRKSVETLDFSPVTVIAEKEVVAIIKDWAKAQNLNVTSNKQDATIINISLKD